MQLGLRDVCIRLSPARDLGTRLATTLGDLTKDGFLDFAHRRFGHTQRDVRFYGRVRSEGLGRDKGTEAAAPEARTYADKGNIVGALRPQSHGENPMNNRALDNGAGQDAASWHLRTRLGGEFGCG